MAESTIVEYLLHETAPFSERPFNSVDSLILSTVSYLHFENGMLARTDPAVLVPIAQAICGIASASLFSTGWLSSFNGNAFLAALLQSPRFMALRVCQFVDESSDVHEKQFGAITFIFPDDSMGYIAFRGTDNTLAGWKEDFNQAFMVGTPSQHAARAYVEKVAQLALPMFYVGGHSKGGNLAEYAAITCSDDAYRKIARVYNHDGPSFCTDVSHRMGTIDYRNRLHKTVPESSVFGLFMERRADYRIVRAKGALLEQHAATNWIVEDGRLADADGLSLNASLLANTLTSWANYYPFDQREFFIDNVFDVLKASGIHRWSDFNDDAFSNMRKILLEAARTDPAKRQAVFAMVGDALGILRDNALAMAREKLPSPSRASIEAPDDEKEE